MSSPSRGNGWSNKRFVNLNATVQNVLLSQVLFGGLIVENNQAAAAWIQIFNLPAASVTLGTTVPDYEFLVAANGNKYIFIPDGVRLGTSLSVASTTTEGGAVASAAGVLANILFDTI